jgi:50S ribosomal protein L16 3-hydroxylase
MLQRPLIRLFLDNVESSDRRFLPRHGDRALRGYLARLQSELRGRCMGLVINNVQLASFALWSELGAWLSGLYRLAAMPAYGVEAGIFLGNYDSTPFGVHQDRVGVLMLMLDGHKQMHLWPPDALTPADVQRHGFSYAQLLPRATTLRAAEGDLLYWPAGFWHVGESQGFSASLNLSLGTHGGTASNPAVPLTVNELVADAVRTLLARRARGSRRARPAALRLSVLREPSRVSEAVDAALDELRRSVSDGDLSLELEAQRLTRATGLGFLAVPAPLIRAPKLSARATLKASTTRPIAWARVGPRMVISANGHAFRLPFHPAVVQLLQRFEHGRSQRVSVLLRRLPQVANIDGVPTRISAPLARAILRQLILIRALSVG